MQSLIGSLVHGFDVVGLYPVDVVQTRPMFCVYIPLSLPIINLPEGGGEQDNRMAGLMGCGSNPSFVISGQSYKASMIVIYDSRVVPDLKIPHITTLES